jgi:spermidine/putrescine transport system permease protein
VVARTTTTGSPPQPSPEGPAAPGDHGRTDPTGRRRFGLQLASTPAGWLLAFLVAPMVMLVIWSLRPPGLASFVEAAPWTLETYRQNLGNAVFLGSLGRTIVTVFVIALASVALAYPVAYVLARVATERRYLLLTLIVAPALVSYLLRLFAWRSLLGTSGVLNQTLERVGLISEPVTFLLYNRFAVIVVLVYVWIPFAALPIFARLEQLPREVVDAARDLGGSPRSTFFRVILPMSTPGVYAAFFFVFIPTLGDFATAEIVGGTGGRMFGNVIRGITQAPDYPSAAVLSLMLFVVAAMAMVIAFRVLRIRQVTDLG